MHEWKYFIHFDGCLHMLTTLLPGIKDIQVVFFLKTITKSTINWDWLNHANNVQLSSVLGSL